MDELVRAYPEGLREAFNIEDMGTPEGSLDSQVFCLAPLALAFFPILTCAGAIAGAEERQRPWTSCSATRCRAGSSSWAASSRLPRRS